MAAQHPEKLVDFYEKYQLSAEDFNSVLLLVKLLSS
jgi:hypothetical protein